MKCVRGAKMCPEGMKCVSSQIQGELMRGELKFRVAKMPGDSGQGMKRAGRFRAGDEKGREIQGRG